MNWTPTPGQRWYANISRSHEAPTFWEIISGTVSPANPAMARAELVKLDVQRATTVEVGGQGRIGASAWSLALYRSEVDDELISTSDSLGAKVGTYNYASRTRHQGIEFGLSGALPGLSLPALGGEFAYRLAWTLSDFFFRGGEFAGKRIAGVPLQVLGGELLYRSGAWSAGPNLRWIPRDTPTDHANTADNYQDAYALWGFKVDYRVDEQLSLYLQGENLGDEVYASSFVIRNRANASQPTFLSGNGRSLGVGLNYRF